MKVLFLDDSEKRIEAVVVHFGNDETIYRHLVICKTAVLAIEALNKEEEWDLVMLDHDLGGEVFVHSGRKDCGMEVVRWIIRTRPKIKRIVVHSWNAPAAKSMVSTLKRAGYETTYEPFSV